MRIDFVITCLSSKILWESGGAEIMVFLPGKIAMLILEEGEKKKAGETVVSIKKKSHSRNFFGPTLEQNRF